MRATHPNTTPLHTNGSCVLLWLWCGAYYHFNSVTHRHGVVDDVVEVRVVAVRQMLRTDGCDSLP